MNIFSFTTYFESEEACRFHFNSELDRIGVNASVVGTEEILDKERLELRMQVLP